MSLLTTGQVAAMRTTAEQALPDLVTISRATPVADGKGGQTITWADLATNVPARISPTPALGKVEDELAGRLATNAPWTITLPHGQAITALDRIIWGARTFEVNVILNVRSWDLDVRVAATEIL